MSDRKPPARAAEWLVSLLAVVFTCLYPCVFMFSLNAGEANAVDMLPFFLLFLATALAALLVLGLLLRSVSRGAVLACLGMLVVINFSLISDGLTRRLPWLRASWLLVLFALILLALLLVLWRKKPRLTAVCGIIALTFGVLTALSLVQAAPKLARTASYRTAGPPTAPPPPSGEPEDRLQGELRNVYYLLFDEYGGDENLETYFGYDNSAFWDALEERGFSVSHTTRNPESVWTDTLVPNMLNLDYVADDAMPEKVRRVYLSEPLLTELFQRSGYRVNLVNHRAFLRLRGARELTAGQTEDNISEYLFRRSIYCKLPWVKDRITYWMFRSYRDNYQGPLNNAISALLAAPGSASGAPTLTVSYIQCPHAPFVYNADGTPRDVTDGTAWYWLDKTLYPGQLQYINTVILEAVDNIQEKDPDAVILLVSDHGARVPLHMVEQFGGPRFDAAAETPVMQNALCCVYIPGTVLDIEGDTCINATRRTMDAVFGTSLGTLEPPEGYVTAEMYNAPPHPDPAEAAEPAENPETTTPAEAPTPPETTEPSPGEETPHRDKDKDKDKGKDKGEKNTHSGRGGRNGD